MKSIIVGTAGHIDHGKTSLVRALTGVDADRLPEEKRRGITIDLGFAELDLDDARVGFVDVPGHERFVKNMLAGAHGIDCVALVVAADEGVMPQTREHFDITRLLGVASGLVVVTKTDAVEDEFVELVRAEVEELVKGSFLEGAPVVAVSSRTGAGLDELKQTLREIAARAPARSADSVALLHVDRSFTVRGFGAVATGTLVAGEISEGDELELLPAGVRARVRGVQVHGRGVGRARAGQRTAINLGGVEASQVARGMTLAPAGRLRPTQVIDASVEVLADAVRPLRSRSRVRVHLGTAEVLARVQALEAAGEISAGARGFAQLRLETPVVALPGERFILRSYSPQRTVAGGVVLDAFAPKHRGRERAAARERLSALDGADAPQRLAIFVNAAGERGLTRADLAARTGWRDEVLDAALAEGKRRETIVDAEGVLVAREILEGLSAAAVREVEAHHRREPLQRGLARETLRERVFAHVGGEVFRAALARAAREGSLAAERDVVRAAGHSLELSPADTRLRESLLQVYRDTALEAPTPDEAFARASAGAKHDREHARKILQLLIDDGTLARVSADLFIHRDALAGLVERLRAYASAHEPERLIDVATFKDLAGVSRKYAIPLLEYFDRERVTRRAGDRRLIL
ncbi:MAG TPA: selenocysteine-specific translation elongation factor [Pyrinomonadaceae bacterium]|jgi:selenocysteine-specific elongation factor|nr:selenocysteine-specific translation elongation factor [Pyrinomonadaceae bacterium]